MELNFTSVSYTHLRVRADDRGDAAIEIPAERDFLRSGLGVEVDEDYFGVDLLQELIGDAEGIVVRGHEHAPLQVDHGVGNFMLVALIQTPARHIRWIVCGTQHAALRAVAVALGHLKKVNDLALVPDVVAGGDDEMCIRDRSCV